MFVNRVARIAGGEGQTSAVAPLVYPLAKGPTSKTFMQKLGNDTGVM